MQLTVSFSQTYSDFDTSLPILLDDVTCSSSDNLLLLCSHRGIGVDDCSHSEDIEITCRSKFNQTLLFLPLPLKFDVY